MVTVTLHILPEEGREGVARRTYDYDRFAAAVSGAVGRPVPISEGPVHEMPANGFVLFHSDLGYPEALRSLLATRPQTILRRLIPLPVPRGEMLPLLSRFPTAALIEYGGYVRWRAGAGPSDSWSGLVGLEPIVAEMGIGRKFVDSPYAMADGHDATLPQLLARYLSAYATRDTSRIG